jgi:hypothetical protein
MLAGSLNKLSFVLVLAILLAGSAVVTISAPSYAQVMEAITIHPLPKILTRYRGLGLIRRGPFTRVIGF